MKGRGIEEHPRGTFLSDFILGSQDGLVNVLGILLGLVAAGASHSLILVAAFAALAAESISMGAVAYTSTLARRLLYLSEVERERAEMRTVPEMEREEVRVILRKWGYQGAEVEEMLQRIEAKPQAMLDIMMAFELNLAEVPASAPFYSFLTVLLATIVGSFIPLLPFLLLPAALATAAYISIGLSAIMLAIVGWYEARTTLGITWKSAIRMVAIGLGAGFAGFLVGHFLGAA
ncbi:MAG TPA: VIT1/CCC1 transporter family protein [Thermoplasmata archaeon]|jgi:vacuolar iron transporter family protein|nr:VIT1/CCC1 transporter family protein [Thermoplasmata archaeon]HTW77409.1 VIT1/CCC1 transporter family protein [Thermoplasmata archaeon]